MKKKLLAGFIILGLLVGAGSIYFKFAFADDNWSEIAKRQQDAEKQAELKYKSKYQVTNLDHSKTNWSGLTSIETDSTSRGRNIDAQAKVSLENALLQFDKIHVIKLTDLVDNGYTGLSSIPTNTQGRDRNSMIDQAKSISMNQAEKTVTDLQKIQTGYVDLPPGDVTDTNGYDRQARMGQTMNDQEAKAAELVNSLALIDGQYVNLAKFSEGIKYVYQSGSVTNEISSDPQLATAKTQVLQNAIRIFNEIHVKHLHELQTPTYGGTMGAYTGSWYQNYEVKKSLGDTPIQKSQSEISNYYQNPGLK